MADWVTISALASAGGTLVLAGVTVASVRSANRAARVAEMSLLAAQRPLLVQSRTDDLPAERRLSDDVWLYAPGGQGAAVATDDAVYLGIAVRNIGTGIAVLHGWHLFPAIQLGPDMQPTPLAEPTLLNTRPVHRARRCRLLARRAARPVVTDYAEARAAIVTPQRMSIDVLYGDFEGGQRAITRFLLTPREGGGRSSLDRFGRAPR